MITRPLEKHLLVHQSGISSPVKTRHYQKLDDFNHPALLHPVEGWVAAARVYRHWLPLLHGGHVHRQTLYYRGSGRGLMQFLPTPGAAIPVPSHRSWLATIGSVGQPRDGRTEAGYALFDRDTERLTFVRVPYDFHAAAAAIRAAGLPDFFADRLSRGE